MNRYRFSWNELYMCAVEVEAENEEQARQIALNRMQHNDYDQKEYGETLDFGSEGLVDGCEDDGCDED